MTIEKGQGVDWQYVDWCDYCRERRPQSKSFSLHIKYGALCDLHRVTSSGVEASRIAAPLTEREKMERDLHWFGSCARDQDGNHVPLPEVEFDAAGKPQRRPRQGP